MINLDSCFRRNDTEYGTAAPRSSDTWGPGLLPRAAVTPGDLRLLPRAAVTRYTIRLKYYEDNNPKGTETFPRTFLLNLIPNPIFQVPMIF